VAGDKVLAAERPPGLLGGLWGLPLVEGPDAAPVDAEALVQALGEAWGWPSGLAPAARLVGGFDWGFTHRLWHVDVYVLRLAAAFPPRQGRWLDHAARAEAGFGGPFRAALAEAGIDGGAGAVSRRSASRAQPG
jgi:hypothetical protein